jgi:methionyl-tRNA formyltransferase
LILPQWVLDAPALGCFNIHGSLLPRWRGAAPIHRAIEAGDPETGITIMQMDAGLDTGDMLAIEKMPITQTDTTASLHDKLAELGGRMMVQTLKDAERGALKPVAQPAEGISYAHKIEKHEAAIDWAQTAQRIVLQVLAFNPFPVASAVIKGETLKIWSAQQLAGTPTTGTECGSILAVTPEGIAIAAMNSIVLVSELQRAGAKRMAAADMVRGFDLQPGMVFEKRSP